MEDIQMDRHTLQVPWADGLSGLRVSAASTGRPVPPQHLSKVPRPRGRLPKGIVVPVAGLVASLLILAAAWACVVGCRAPAKTPLFSTTRFGGSEDEWAYALTLDASGNIYVAGRTFSADFPATPGAYSIAEGGDYDAFIAKLDPTGRRLLFATFLGGSGRDVARSIAVDGLGNVYVAGETTSVDFPVTRGAFDTTRNGTSDAFVAKLDTTGTHLLFSTYLGGEGDDFGKAISVDQQGILYVSGRTGSIDFPVTLGASDTTLDGPEDAFLAILDTLSGGLLGSTFIGGSGDEAGWDVAIGVSNDAWVLGTTNSSDFPVTPGSFDPVNNGAGDVFLVRVDTFGSRLQYATYIGGSGVDEGSGLALGPEGQVFVVGRTSSLDFPVTGDAFDGTHNGGVWDGFLVRLEPTAGEGYGTFLGGTGDDRVESVGLDDGSVLLAGLTSSRDFPSTSGAFSATHSEGLYDAFVMRLDELGRLAYASYLGGSDHDWARGVVGDSGRIIVAGWTASLDFPATTSLGPLGIYDVFVAIGEPNPQGPAAGTPYLIVPTSAAILSGLAAVLMWRMDRNKRTK